MAIRPITIYLYFGEKEYGLWNNFYLVNVFWVNYSSFISCIERIAEMKLVMNVAIYLYFGE